MCRVPAVSDMAQVQLRSRRVQAPASSLMSQSYSSPLLSSRLSHSPSSTDSPHTSYQGLTLVHFSAQRRRFVSDRGYTGFRV